MIFSLEALPAKYGDSLLLHYGKADDPRLIVIDGGPSGVYKAALLPRLEELRSARGGTLPIEMVMVSHLDDDHVRGILDFSRALEDNDTMRSGFEIGTLWLNSFDDTVGKGKPVTSSSDVVPAGVDDGQLAAVTASVGEGRNLRDIANGLKWKLNEGFDELVTVPDDSGVEVDLHPLQLTVVGPRTAELEELRKEWAKEVAKLPKAKPAEVAKIAEYLDNSVYNLSSIVCLAELGKGKEKKRILLTGDARGDKILLGLEAAGVLKKGGSIEIDLLKMPHHGSCRNLEKAFFERIKAKAMVISANGKFHNPDVETLEMISAARPDDDFTLYLTYTDFDLGMGPKIHGFIDKETESGRKYKTTFRPDADPSLRIDLLDPLT